MASSPSVVIGHLMVPHEQGAGTTWCIDMDGVPGYDGLFSLEPGDELLIYEEDGRVAWHGAMEFVRPCEEHAPAGHPQQGALDFAGFGLQTQVSAEQWSAYFHEGRPAVARLHQPSGYRDIGALVEALNTLRVDAPRALMQLMARNPVLGARIVLELDNLWVRLGDKAGWRGETTLATLDDKAQAWRVFLAACHAARADWRHARRWSALDAFLARYPTRDLLTEQDIQYWLDQRLPHDDVFDD